MSAQQNQSVGGSVPEGCTVAQELTRHVGRTVHGRETSMHLGGAGRWVTAGQEEMTTSTREPFVRN